MDSSSQSRREHSSKRHRESDEVLDESSIPCKRHCRETLAHKDLVAFFEIDDMQDDRFWDEATQEELICGVIRSLEEEISASDYSDSSQCSMEGCLLPAAFESSWSSINKDNSLTNKSCTTSVASPTSFSGSDESQFGDDIGFLLDASDDELGIPSSPSPDSVESCDKSSPVLEIICLEEDSAVDMESWQTESVWSLENTLEFSCVDDCDFSCVDDYGNP